MTLPEFRDSVNFPLIGHPEKVFLPSDDIVQVFSYGGSFVYFSMPEGTNESLIFELHSKFPYTIQVARISLPILIHKNKVFALLDARVRMNRIINLQAIPRIPNNKTDFLHLSMVKKMSKQSAILQRYSKFISTQQSSRTA